MDGPDVACNKVSCGNLKSRPIYQHQTSGGSRPGHKVSGTRSKFSNLNENGQKSHFL